MAIGPRVRERRRELGFTQEQLASQTGVTLSAVQRLEGGRITDPHYSTLLSIANALHTTVAELVGESTAVPKAPAPSAGQPSETPRIASIGPTGRGPNVSHEMLAELGIEATDAELNALNIYLEGRARSRVDAGPVSFVSLERDNIDAEKVMGWTPAVEDALSNWIALGRFTLAPGTEVSEKEIEAVRRHAREKLASSSGAES
jgi:transcriptional regulator with XRE-family HTH domain